MTFVRGPAVRRGSLAPAETADRRSPLRSSPRSPSRQAEAFAAVPKPELGNEKKPDGSFVEWDRVESLPELFAAAVLERLAALTDEEIEAAPASALFAENVDAPLAEITHDEAVLQAERFLIGRTVEVELSEFGVSGAATILSIPPCPQAEPDDGTGRRLVTAVFRHCSRDIYDVQIAGEPTLIGTTGNHPFWSEDRQTFVRADELRRGERLRRANDSLTTVTSLAQRHLAEPVTVYNLEVDGHHVYYVGDGGVLVHNSYQVTTNRVTGLAAEASLATRSCGHWRWFWSNGRLCAHGKEGFPCCVATRFRMRIGFVSSLFFPFARGNLAG